MASWSISDRRGNIAEAIIEVMMKKEEDSVLYYSGYKGEETPRAVILGGREYPINEVLWRKRISDRNTGRELEIFGCKVAGRTIEIRRDDSGRSEILFSGASS